MSRRKAAVKRDILPDARFGNVTVEKFIRHMMVDGKKSVSTKIVYTALETVAKKSGEDALTVFLKALENVKPAVEVKSRRVGGSTYQVPTEVNANRSEALSMRWVIAAARGRNGHSMSEKLGNEILDAYANTGSAFKKKEDTHRMADANKAFSHFRW